MSIEIVTFAFGSVVNCCTTSSTIVEFPEFTDEAVRQVVDRGYFVAEVAVRLGMSAHSLYKWVKAVKSSNSEQRKPLS